MTWATTQQGPSRGNGVTAAPPAQHNLQIPDSASPRSRQPCGRRRRESPEMGQALNPLPTATETPKWAWR